MAVIEADDSILAKEKRGPLTSTPRSLPVAIKATSTPRSRTQILSKEEAARFREPLHFTPIVSDAEDEWPT